MRELVTTVFYGWWIVLACFLIAFYVGGGLFYGFTAFFEPIVEEFNWSYTQVSIAFSLRGLEMGILAPLTGFLVDRFGPRALVFSGTLIVGFALILLSLSNSLLMFYSAFVLLAFGTSGCASTVLLTVVAHWFRRHVGRAMGIVVCGFGAGGTLIPFIVWLIDLYQWRITLIILALGIWSMGIPLSFVVRHRPEQYGYLPDGEKPTGSISPDTTREVEDKSSFRDLLIRREFWILGVAEAIRVMIAMAVVTHVMPYLSSVGIPRGSAALVATSIPFLSIIGRLGFGWLGDIFEKRYVLAVAYCLLGMGTFAFSYVHIKWLILPFLLLFSLAFGATVALRGAIVREYFGRTYYGRLLGITIGMTAIGAVIGPSVAGWTYDSIGSYRPVWLCFSAATAIAIVLALQLKVPRQTRRG